MKVLKFLVVILLLSGCTTPSSEEVTQFELDISESRNEISRLKEEIGVLQEENNNYANESDRLNSMLETIGNRNSIEITENSIYMLRHRPRLGKDIINEIRSDLESEVESSASYFHYEDESIIDFEVSEDNKYIAILLYSNDVQQLKLMNHNGDTIFSYDYEEFLLEFGDLSMSELLWKIHGFDIDGKILWGGFGGELDLVARFIYLIDTEEFIVFDGTNSEEFQDYFEKYPVVW